MAQNLLERAAGTLVSVTIPPVDGEVERILFDAKNFATRSGNGTLLMVNVPNDSERGLLSARKQMLSLSMEFDRHKVALLIAQMLNCYAHPIKENETAEQVVSLYVRELSLPPVCPTWAISQAIGNIRIGQAPGVGLVHRPSTIAVRRIADGFAWKVKSEIVSIGDVLKGRAAAPEIAPEERAKLGKKFRAFADGLLSRQRAREAKEEQDDADRLRQMIGVDAFAKLPDAPKRRGSLLGKEAAKIAAGGRR
jgi:hypothetical protein